MSTSRAKTTRCEPAGNEVWCIFSLSILHRLLSSPRYDALYQVRDADRRPSIFIVQS